MAASVSESLFGGHFEERLPEYVPGFQIKSTYGWKNTNKLHFVKSDVCTVS